MNKIESFDLGYGFFSRTLYYGEDNLSINFPRNREGLIFITPESEFQYLGVCLISGYTPGTYYSGNREYGKVVFSLPEGVIVKKTNFISEDGSNSGADKKNTCFLKLQPFRGF